jgi:hypothetical protein
VGPKAELEAEGEEKGEYGNEEDRIGIVGGSKADVAQAGALDPWQAQGS